MIEISLSSWEMMLAAQAGVMRQIENLQKGRKPYYGAGTENDWQLHIEGCLGELALAKYLGVYWMGKGYFRLSDVGNHEVRTRSKDYYELILHPRDSDEKYFWLLCGVNGKYQIKGCILGKDGKKKEYLKDPTGKRPPAYFVPCSMLIPPDEFLRND